LEAPKPEIKVIMTSDQAKKNIEEEKKEAADDKEREAKAAAKLKTLSNVGEKKSATDEVPVAKCPSELKKEKDDADKVTKEAEEKVTTAKLVAAEAVKQAAYEKKEAVKEKAAEVVKKEAEAEASQKEIKAGFTRITEEKNEVLKHSEPTSETPLTADEHWAANGLGERYISEAQK
jgi:hypothetical protein